MKKIIMSMILLIVTTSSVFAFTPDYQLKNRIGIAAEKIMEIISARTIEYGNSVLNTIDLLQSKYQADDRASYILDSLETELVPFMNCVSVGGVRVLGVDECEEIGRVECLSMGGVFNECASACRHDPDALVCTLQCVQVCEVPVMRDESMGNTYIIDGQEIIAEDDIYLVNSARRSCTNDKGYMSSCYQIKSEEQIGWSLDEQGIVGLNWEPGHIYTVRAIDVDGTLNLVELLNTEVDYEVCTQIYDGCNTCDIKNDIITNCTERACNNMMTTEDRCISVQ